MPAVAYVEGVKIELYPIEHPSPHFHAWIAEFTVQIEIRTGLPMRGSLPPAKLRAVVERAAIHRVQLMEAWSAVEEKR